MSGAGHIVEATDCTTGACYTHWILERGYNISFVSTEQVRRSGAKRFVRPTGPNGEREVYWEPRLPRADVTFPRGFVLVHDTTGELLHRCDMYIVRKKRGAKFAPDDVPQNVLNDAESYFVDQHEKALPILGGSVEIPQGPWVRLARVRLIRYRRAGFSKPFEHAYDPPVEVHYSRGTLGYRLPLPNGCIVDDHGFRWP